jgi:hypothetical protein
MFFSNFQRGVIVLLTVSTLVFSQPVSDPNNLIKNGGFDKDFTGWNYKSTHGSDPKGSVVNGEMVCANNKLGIGVQVDGKTIRTYDLQFYQPDLTIQQGITYVLRFDAKSDSAGRFLQVAVENQADFGNSQYCVDAAGKNYSFNLTTTMKTYTLIFKMTKPTDSKVRLNFNFGDALPTVYFDNISILDSTKTTATRFSSAGFRECGKSQSINVDSRGMSFFISDPAHFQYRICSPSGKLVAGSNFVNYGSGSHYRIEFPSLGISSGTYIAQVFDGQERYSKVFSVIP